MATIGEWIEGARLRTLPMAVAPVAIGAGAAFEQGAFSWVRTGLALLVALFLQVGVNYSNDYSDGVRGTDDVRVGPLRLTASGAAPAKTVRNAALLNFALAGLAGLGLVLLSGAWVFLIIGVASVIAAWGYTGGKNPYGYRGLGEVFVFIFFGLVAVLGTQYTQSLQLSWVAFIGACSTGLLATALLMANNIRDIPTDSEVGKRTLAVRLGDGHARTSYVLMVALAILLPLTLVGIYPWVLLSLLVIPMCIQPCWTVLRSESPVQLIPVLRQTGLVNLAFGLLYGGGLVIQTLFFN